MQENDTDTPVAAAADPVRAERAQPTPSTAPDAAPAAGGGDSSTSEGGASSEGGGKNGRLSFATSVSAADGRWNTLLGVQAEKSDPVWSSQRDLTKQFNLNGYNGASPVASRDWMIFDELAGKYVMIRGNATLTTVTFSRSKNPAASTATNPTVRPRTWA